MESFVRQNPGSGRHPALYGTCGHIDATAHWPLPDTRGGRYAVRGYQKQWRSLYSQTPLSRVLRQLVQRYNILANATVSHY